MGSFIEKTIDPLDLLGMKSARDDAESAQKKTAAKFKKLDEAQVKSTQDISTQLQEQANPKKKLPAASLSNQLGLY